VEEFKQRISDLAELMDEFRLSEAEMTGEGWRVTFRRRAAVRPVQASSGASAEAELPTDASFDEEDEAPEKAPAGPTGTPVSSPMTGIFYLTANPASPAFVKEGDQVSVGQVVGLIEAMKVYNEITAAFAGTVTKIVAESGTVVQPGEPLMYIG
jgi:acetyl-CoA carboxylase biotin carboxyl carrier protein